MDAYQKRDLMDAVLESIRTLRKAGRDPSRMRIVVNEAGWNRLRAYVAAFGLELPRPTLFVGLPVYRVPGYPEELAVQVVVPGFPLDFGLDLRTMAIWLEGSKAP